MSRIGKAPIEIPAGVEFSISKGNFVKVKGPKGELSQQVSPDLSLDIEDGVLSVNRPSDHPRHRSMHGLYRSLIANMILGVTKGYEKGLKIPI